MKTKSKHRSTRKVNVAVVGLGFMGVTHLRAYLQNRSARVVAVCDAVRLPVKGVLAGVAGNIKKTADIHLGKGVKVFRQLEEVLAEPDVELVDLCTPTPLHREQSMEVLNAGKHVLCEKPLARTSVDARKILKAGESAHGFLMPAMCMRFWPGWSWLKQVVDKRTYGQVLAARFRRLSEMPGWSKQGTYTGSTDLGGALFDLHIHDTDFVPEGSWLLAKGFHMAYTLQCERATVDFDLARGPEALQVTETGQSTRVIKSEQGDGYSLEIDYMLECVLRGRPPKVVNARDAVTTLEICEAEEESVKSGKVVRL